MDPKESFNNDYNRVGLRTTTTTSNGNNAGVKSVVGSSDPQSTQNPVSPSGDVRSSGSVGYYVGIGWWMGFDKGVPKFFLGDHAGNNMTWDGSTLSIVGTITATTGNIGGFTIGATTLSATSGGNTTTMSSGSTPFSAGPTGAPNFSVDSSGYVTAIGISTLNKKVFTNFEGSGRFIASTGAGTNAPVFGNQGVTIAPSAVATTYCKMLWSISYVFNNNPTFTCTVLANSIGTSDGAGFVGLGNPTISGSGFTETGKNYCGFEFKKASGVLTIIAIQCDGGATPAFSSTLVTVSNGDSIELFIKMNASSIDYYTRQNGGALSSKTTLSTHMPSASEEYAQFSMTNKGNANDLSMIMQSAGYEH